MRSLILGNVGVPGSRCFSEKFCWLSVVALAQWLRFFGCHMTSEEEEAMGVGGVKEQIKTTSFCSINVTLS